MSSGTVSSISTPQAIISLEVLYTVSLRLCGALGPSSNRARGSFTSHMPLLTVATNGRCRNVTVALNELISSFRSAFNGTACSAWSSSGCPRSAQQRSHTSASGIVYGPSRSSRLTGLAKLAPYRSVQYLTVVS
ncbi:uncharacterized protein EAE98_007215 [Botrytis deweyae]|uniref:Uncharacterized protein n=1 Tax=Botrytis deweyae TaxID=2478750 RepID=A0ABQ7IIE0_9HELO|nr:uncharacterized protein EAE98_007215 [Botrytis deweyae]KAF7923343.1 hypothetical protein EAE99_007040 [Botrytis elliptica]KAF7925127.1 hypothetical protein EAE98_007215 [Botrytis deweyae]